MTNPQQGTKGIDQKTRKTQWVISYFPAFYFLSFLPPKWSLFRVESITESHSKSRKHSSKELLQHKSSSFSRVFLKYWAQNQPESSFYLFLVQGPFGSSYQFSQQCWDVNIASSPFLEERVRETNFPKEFQSVSHKTCTRIRVWLQSLSSFPQRPLSTSILFA